MLNIMTLPPVLQLLSVFVLLRNIQCLLLAACQMWCVSRVRSWERSACCQTVSLLVSNTLLQCCSTHRTMLTNTDSQCVPQCNVLDAIYTYPLLSITSLIIKITLVIKLELSTN